MGIRVIYTRIFHALWDKRTQAVWPVFGGPAMPITVIIDNPAGTVPLPTTASGSASTDNMNGQAAANITAVSYQINDGPILPVTTINPDPAAPPCPSVSWSQPLSTDDCPEGIDLLTVYAGDDSGDFNAASSPFNTGP